MSEPVLHRSPFLPLRVAVVAVDPAQRARLIELVQTAGHTIVTLSQADVMLSDRVTPSTAIPTVVLDPSDGGHAGHLQQDASAAQIDAALRAVANGLIVRHPNSRPSGFEELAERATMNLLTPRELDVLMAISDGMSNKAIARELGISLHTVKFHVESLFRKLGARTRAEAVARGLERRRAETVEI